jgi:hypothetical protein
MALFAQSAKYIAKPGRGGKIVAALESALPQQASRTALWSMRFIAALTTPTSSGCTNSTPTLTRTGVTP